MELAETGTAAGLEELLMKPSGENVTYCASAVMIASGLTHRQQLR